MHKFFYGVSKAEAARVQEETNAEALAAAVGPEV